MALIVLEGIRFYSYHGYYEEEQLIGNDFVLDVIVSTNAEVAAKKDALYHAEENEEQKPVTVNYEILFLLCQKEMRKPVKSLLTQEEKWKPAKLLEALVERIADKIEAYFDNVDGLAIRLRKLNPPLGGRVDSAWVATARGDLDFSYLGLVRLPGKMES